MPATTNQAGRSRETHWLSWLAGTAALGAVVAAALHVSEQQAFVRLAERAEPSWLGVAAVLQAGTYAAQGWIWRLVSAAAGGRLSHGAALQLAFAKLFTDQALPSAGLKQQHPRSQGSSGTVTRTPWSWRPPCSSWSSRSG